MMTPTNGWSFLLAAKGRRTYLPGRTSSTAFSEAAGRGFRSVLGPWAALVLLFGCAGPVPAPAAPTSPSQTTETAPPKTVRAHTLGPRELELEARLEEHVRKLSVEVGPRSVDEQWELAAAADYVAEELEGMGFTLERQGFDVGEVVAQNVGVEVPGGDLGEETIVVGAHYDTTPGNRGANSNATGVAALLVLADAFKTRTPRRKLRFVGYALDEAPHFGTDSMGSLRHSKALAARGEKVSLMLSLDSLGNFSSEAGSQRTLEGIERPLPAVGDFVLVLGAPASRSAGDRLARGLDAALGEGTGIEVAVRTLGDPDAPGLASDDWAFRRVGFPALVVSDTKDLRIRSGEDRIEAVNFEHLTRIVSALEASLAALADTDALTPEK